MGNVSGEVKERETYVTKTFKELSEDNNELNAHYRKYCMIFAIKNGRIKVVENLLQLGVDPNTVLRNRSLLELAIISGKHKITSLLLSYGASTRARHMTSRRSPIFEAIYCRKGKVLTALLRHDPSLKYESLPNKNTPLHEAVECNSAKIVSTLLKFGVCLDTKNQKGLTALLLCLLKPSVPFDIVSLLLRAGADANLTQGWWRTPLQYATRLDDPKFIHILMKYGANINDASLTSAIEFGMLENAKILLEYGADVNEDLVKIDGFQYRPLTMAVEKNNIEAIRLLRQYNAEVNYCVFNRMTLLLFAACTSNLETFQLLISYGADVQAISWKKFTVLHHAACNDKVDILRFLVNSEYEFNLEDRESLVLRAICMRKKHNLYFLLNKGFTLNYEKDSDEFRKHLMFDTFNGRRGINEIIVTHIVKMKLLNVYVPEEFLEHRNNAIDQTEQMCKIEIFFIKGEIVSTYKNISLYDFMIKDSYDVRFLRNEGMANKLASRKALYRKNYPHYYYIIKYKIDKFLHERNLMIRSHAILSDILYPKFNLSQLCISHILQSFSTKDMMLLNKRFLNKHD